jgi:deazaflavin-dependent oxidoreductase (nitroreductase family)
MERVSPLAFQWVGESFAIFASKAGAPEHPAWYHNLLAYPHTTVEVGTDIVEVRAQVAQPAERDVLYDRQKQRSPAFAQYEAKAAPRKIPVVVLDPVK